MSIQPYGFIAPTVQYKTPTDLSRVVPRRAVSLVPEEYLVYRGMPLVPRSGVMAQVLVSGNGTMYNEPTALDDAHPDSWASFVADDPYWDPVTGIWTPAHDQSPVLYYMQGTVGDLPRMEPISYRCGKVLYTHNALTLNDTQHMTTVFNEGLDDATNFTISLAVSLFNTGPSDILVFSDGDVVGVNRAGLYATMEGTTWYVKIPSGANKMKPLYIILRLAPPVATLYAGFAPTLVYKGSSQVTTNTTKFAFNLQSEMSVFGLDIWGDDAPAVSELVARYAGALGANDTTVSAFV